MRRFVVVLALFVGVALGLAVVSQSFMSVYDDATSGDLSVLYPAYIPLSYSSSNIGVYGYETKTGTVYKAVAPPFDASNPLLFFNFFVDYVSSPFSVVSGYTFYFDSSLSFDRNYELTVTIPGSYGRVASLSSYVDDVLGSVGSVVRYVSSFPSSAGYDVSSFDISILDSSYNFIQSLGTVRLGSTNTYSFHIPSDYSGFYIYFSFSTTFGSYSYRAINALSCMDFTGFSARLSYLPLYYPLITESNGYLEHVSLNTDSIVSYLEDLSISAGTPSEMTKFEDAYIQSMAGQLSQVEDMLGPQNTALPNGGDVAGFVSDIQDGLGLSGSSFNASDFSDAVSAFGQASAVQPGGPWEFFSQSVADSLSGDTQTVGLSYDDYIYAWLEESQRRYGLWSSSSP